ncbi:MAG: leucine-rich repeat protein, partial [Treponema sp.]|nr:leucine-rich repeat protein [Treponema sp.]
MKFKVKKTCLSMLLMFLCFCLINAQSYKTEDTDIGITAVGKSGTSYIAGNSSYGIKKDHAVKPYTKSGKTIKINKGVTVLYKGFLDDELDAEKIVLTSSVTTIERGALPKWCSISCATKAQKDFCLKNGYAVEGTYSIKKNVLTVNKGVTVISPVIARGDTSITKIVLPNTVKIIDAFAFSDMTNLSSITIPESVEIIGAAAFMNCSKINSINIPESVTYIGEKAFIGTKVQVVEIGNAAKYEADTFENRVVVTHRITGKGDPVSNTVAGIPLLHGSKGWQENDFSSKEKEFAFQVSTEKLKTGKNSITFTYTSGEATLYIKDIEIIADGKTILADNNEYIVGEKSRDAAYTFMLGSIPGKLYLKGKARTDSGSETNGIIVAKNIPVEDIIKEGTYSDYKDEVLDIPAKIQFIEKNAFNTNTKLRVPVGSYAEKWARENGYYLCGAISDLSIYSKNKSLKIEEDFERILCYTDTPDDIDRYHFNVTHPLTLD